MNVLKKLPWGLIAGLGVLALIRRVLIIAGVYESLGWARGPMIVAVLVAFAWVGIVVLRRVAQPLLTLVFAGAAYGILAIVVNLVGQAFLPAVQAMSAAEAATFIGLNVLWGAVLGLVAMGVLSLLAPQRAEEESVGG